MLVKLLLGTPKTILGTF